jgi:hypothetical protein
VVGDERVPLLDEYPLDVTVSLRASTSNDLARRWRTHADHITHVGAEYALLHN